MTVEDCSMWAVPLQRMTLTEVGSCPYDGCSPASSGTKTTSAAVSICKMNQVAEVRRTVLMLYSMNKSGNFKCNTLANRQPVEFLYSWCDVGSAFQTKDETGCSVLNALYVRL